MNALLHALAMLLALVSGGIVHAQAYSNKPKRLVVGYAPGGGTDRAFRLVAVALSELWDITALVDNRSGAGGGIATEITKLRQRMEEQGIDVTPSTPEQYLAHVKSETLKSAKVLEDAGLASE